MRVIAAVLAIAIAGAAGYWGLALLQPRTNLPISYYRVVDPSRLAIGVIGGPGRWNRAYATSTSSSVRVTAESSSWPFMLSRAMAVSMELTVTLAEPLAERTVTDSEGRPIERSP